MLGLAADDFRVIGLALAEFAAGPPRDTHDHFRTYRNHARHLHHLLARYGYLAADPPAGGDNGVLPLGPGSFRVIGLALAAYAATPAPDSHGGDGPGPGDEDDREQAEFLHAQLASWRHLPAEPQPG